MQDFISSSIGYLLLIGTVSDLVLLSGAWIDTARLICMFSWASFKIWGTKPTVETVIFLAPKFNPKLLFNFFIELTVFS